ncbi:DUF1836 domain-containing protein [uncultured Clostridium sp.]|uniref:DUF1836 domain-containing protein n=1 Tax=uncultured Clostridium sp. TaxID=59620 RepID=UPI0026266141|nr:DUF1836 domain-containing protein [uncultured Clostridium sp.]
MEILEILNNLNLENNIKLDEIPEIDLYMDQVIQLFESKLSEQKSNEDEKILTKTMINNYAKGKLLLPIKNKKYSKEHIILMSLIYNLKGALSINDIKASLEEIIDNPEEERHSLRDLYTCFLENCINDESNFKEDVINKIKKIDDKIEKNKLLNDEFEKRFLLLCSLVNMSNMYRRMSEKLIDEFFSKQE